MNLATALRIQTGDLVTFTGAGGKTTAMLRLGRELAASGLRVIATTTTQLGLDQLDLFPEHLFSPEPAEIDAALPRSGLLFVAREQDAGRGKALGFPPEDIASFRNHADVVLVEGDGAKRRPLKAPAPYEPVVPPATTHLVTVLGLWALGRPFDAETVHRPEIFAQLTGLNPGDLITPNVLARLLLHPQGPVRGAPPAAERHALLNGSDLRPLTSDLRSLASRLAAQPAFTAVHLAQLTSDPPVVASYGQMAAVVLAAGGSSRFGSPKQLHEWQGQALLRHVVMQTLAAPVQEIIVVLGAYFEEIAPLLHGLPVTIVRNAEWKQGQSASMKVGLRASAPGTQAALFVLGDQPHLPEDLLHQLIDTHRRTLAPIVAPHHQGRRGNPVLFDRQCFPELMAITGDTGGRPLFERYRDQVAWVEVDAGVFLDIDEPS